jgi:hypothetical protein
VAEINKILMVQGCLDPSSGFALPIYDQMPLVEYKKTHFRETRDKPLFVLA